MGLTAKRVFKKDGKITKVMVCGCPCGNNEKTINTDDPEYATCTACLRIYRRMTDTLPDGTIVECWGVYYDPYLKNTLAGQFIMAIGVDLPEERYPRPLVKGTSEE